MARVFTPHYDSGSRAHHACPHRERRAREVLHYETALDPQNLVFCTCEAWRYFGHTCTHLKASARS
jgi:hypothetical protein